MAEYLNPKTFVVSWISFFDNELHSQQVLALNRYQAIELSKCDIFDLEDFHMITDFQDLKVEAFNRDAMIEVIEIKLPE